MKHRPHEEIPLVLFGIAAAVLVASQMLTNPSARAVAMVSYLALLAGMSSVMVVVRQWRYG
ncbi:MAG TPA: hypothetical protein HA224_02870 [Nanoarchaeota archaeon]|nr:hypothetical protein [Nanoarchaeota archaeon]